jgi:stearoyl-CoA desaturase (Delta-9 desaturase)
MPRDSAAQPGGDIVHPSAIPFILVHLACGAALWTGVSWQAAALCAALYWLRMFAITAGYHRYFSHRAYATGRGFQFLLACLAQSTAQKSVLWWAAKHRHHHLHSDTAQDPHSPRQGGFFHSHIGWIFDRRHDATDLVKVEDLARFPELRWLHKYEAVPPIVLAGLCWLIAGWPGLIVGFCWSTALVYHATFSINSLAHVHGARRYVTGDDSRNNPVLAVLTMGEGWHNNHHAYQSSARQGFRWWELDATYYALRALAGVGVVWDLKAPPPAVLRNEQPLSARVMQRTVTQLAARFDAEQVASEIQASPQMAELAAVMGEAFHHARERVAELLAGRHLPPIPDRAAFAREARRLFATTGAFDEIVDRARALFLTAVGEHLARPGLQPALQRGDPA